MPEFRPSDRFDRDEMAAFMRRPDIFTSMYDALSPPPEAFQFEDHMLRNDIWTMALCYGQTIVAFVQFTLRTSVMAEVACGAHPEVRGKLAGAFGEYCAQMAFAEKGLFKLVANVAADNKEMLLMLRLHGFKQIGVIEKCIAKGEKTFNRGRLGERIFPAGLRDLCILTRDRPKGN